MRVLRVSKKEIGWFFLLIFFFNTTYLSRFSLLENIFNYGRVAVLFVILLMIVKNIQNFHPSGLFILLSVYEVYLICITFYRGGALITSITSAMAMMGFVLIIEFLGKRDLRVLLNVLMLIFELLIYANFVVMLLFPEGLYNTGGTRKYWLFGHQNGISLYVLCAIVVSVLWSYFTPSEKGASLRYGKHFQICIGGNGILKPRALALIGISILSIIWVWSATSVAGLAVLAITLILTRMKIRLNMKQAIIVSIVFFFGFVILRVQDNFAFIIETVLKRNLTFSARTAIWDNALYYISRRPVFGYGVEMTSVATERFGFNTTHCKYLYTMYQGGTILVIFFLFILLYISNLVKKVRSEMAVIFIAYSWAILIQMQFESYTEPIFYLPFILALCCADKESVSNHTRRGLEDERFKNNS